MATRWQLTVIALCMLLATPSARADIYRWGTGEVIPGTEGIEPEPGMQLDGMELQYADLSGLNLTGVNFNSSNLTEADLSRTVVTEATFWEATLTDARLTGAVVTGATHSTPIWVSHGSSFTRRPVSSRRTCKASG